MSLQFLSQSYSGDGEEGERANVEERNNVEGSTEKIKQVEKKEENVESTEKVEKEEGNGGNATCPGDPSSEKKEEGRLSDNFDPTSLLSVQMGEMCGREGVVKVEELRDESQTEENGVGDLECPMLDLCNIIEEYRNNAEGNFESPPHLTPESEVNKVKGSRVATNRITTRSSSNPRPSLKTADDNRKVTSVKPINNHGRNKRCCEHGKDENANVVPKKTFEDWRSFKCQLCPKKFMYSYKLKIHMRSHTGERPYKCSECKKGFMDAANFQKHLNKEHGGQGSNMNGAVAGKCMNKVVTVSKVNQKRITQPDLANKADTGIFPILTLPQDHPFLCPFCFKSFRANISLIKHLEEHIPGFKAPSGFPPVQQSQSVQSKSTVTNKPVGNKAKKSSYDRKCLVCNKSFAHVAKLLIHMRIHTGCRPYTCTLCNMRFRQEIHLTRHIQTIHKIQGDVKPHCSIEASKISQFDEFFTRPCKILLARCDVASTTSSNTVFQSSSQINAENNEDFHPTKAKEDLNQILIKSSLSNNSMKSTVPMCRNGRKLLKGPECSKIFNSNDQNALCHALKTRTGKKWKCQHCGNLYSRLDNLTVHINRTHSDGKLEVYPCTQCGRVFKWKKYLDQHMMLHIRGKKSFECKDCHTRFNWLKSLKTHVSLKRCPALR